MCWHLILLDGLTSRMSNSVSEMYSGGEAIAQFKYWNPSLNWNQNLISELYVPGVCSFRWILAVCHRACFNTSIVMLWEKQSRHTRICAQISKMRGYKLVNTSVSKKYTYHNSDLTTFICSLELINLTPVTKLSTMQANSMPMLEDSFTMSSRSSQWLPLMSSPLNNIINMLDYFSLTKTILSFGFTSKATISHPLHWQVSSFSGMMIRVSVWCLMMKFTFTIFVIN